MKIKKETRGLFLILSVIIATAATTTAVTTTAYTQITPLAFYQKAIYTI
jgi:hypothetical protein